MEKKYKIIKRIVIIGPPNSGKTTLAKKIAKELECTWIPEFSRIYSEKADFDLSSKDVFKIGRGQWEAEEKAESKQPESIVFDTNIVMTEFYSNWYYGFCPQWIKEKSRKKYQPLYEYILCKPIRKWEPDGIRQFPNSMDSMYFELIDFLKKRKIDFKFH